MINYNLKEFEKNGSIILEDKRFQRLYNIRNKMYRYHGTKL